MRCIESDNSAFSRGKIVESKMADRNVTGEQAEMERLENSIIPERILIFSGKRKSGKDYVTDELFKRLGTEKSVIIKLSGPIKTHFAKTKNLDEVQLFGDGEYKEIYRLEMIKWGEDLRNEDYGYFCRAAIDMYNAKSKHIWIISDARRKSDLKWFKENYGDLCRTVRISSSEEVRKSRGWVYTKGVDDSETECDLDDVSSWDLTVQNNNEIIEFILKDIIDLLK